jgi:hypothetical protein
MCASHARGGLQEHGETRHPAQDRAPGCLQFQVMRMNILEMTDLVVKMNQHTCLKNMPAASFRAGKAARK